MKSEMEHAMNIQFPKFVGRETQMAKIREQIARPGTVVVNIAGGGGVGKTTLLRKIVADYRRNVAANTLVTEVIDFSHTVHRVQTWVLDRIAAIQPEAFEDYFAQMEGIEALDPLVRMYREREALDAFVKNYNTLAEHYRIILLFDTVELVQNTHLLTFIIELVSEHQLSNTVLILAGRHNDAPEITERLQAVFDPQSILTIHLTGFDEEEAHRYFEEAITPGLRELNPNLLENIYVLSDRNPIKIALSLDWLNRGIPLMTEITRITPEELRSRSEDELNEMKERFEHALMDGIRKLESPLYDVILYMAHFHKRFNKRMLEFFFPDQPADALLERLANLPFVKYINDDYFVLHDEMTRLVQKHVWDAVEDPDRTLRRDLSQQVCEYYRQELATFPPSSERTEQENITFWSYSVERMSYQLDTHFQTGYYRFETLFEELVADQRPGLASLAISFLEEFRHEKDYSPLLTCFVDGYYKGGVLLAQQRFREAEQTLQAKEQHLTQIIADLDWERAAPLDLHLRNQRHKVYHQLGFCYRSLGNWEQAIENYQRSLELALELAAQIDLQTINAEERQQMLMAQVAETLNSLANVYRLQGKLHQASLLCRNSILLRQTWEPQQVCKSQYVMGMVMWEIGNSTMAVDYLRFAEQSCPLDDEMTLALIKKYRAYVFYRAGLPEQAIPLLEEAISVFQQRGQFSDLADALNIRSRIYRDHPHLPLNVKESKKEEEGQQWSIAKALELARKAYEIAERIGDEYRLAECHLTLAIHHYRLSQIEPQQGATHRQIALSHYEDGIKLARDRYYQLLSLYSAVRGHIAFDERDYEEAFRQYTQQCRLATRFKRAVYERAIDTLGNRLRELGNKDAITAELITAQVRDAWQQAQLSDEFPELLDEIAEIEKAILEQEELNSLKWEYRQAMLDGRWQDAIASCDRTLQISGLYTDVNRANILIDRVEALRKRGSIADLSEARRLAKVALQIGEDLNDPALIGNAHLSMAHVLWDTTSTAEAADHLAAAAAAFQEAHDPLRSARVEWLQAYMQYRTGFFREPLNALVDIAHVFQRHNLSAYLADVWNLMSRITRTDPDRPDLDTAGEYVERAFRCAKSAHDYYRLGECTLSRAFLAYRQQDWEQALQLCKQGLSYLTPETHLVRSVYYGLQGNVYFRLANAATRPKEREEYWQQAFEAYTNELVAATQAKPARLIRALDLIHIRMIRLPADLAPHYANQLETAWRQHHLEEEFPVVIDMCRYVIQYRPYIHIEQ